MIAVENQTVVTFRRWQNHKRHPNGGATVVFDADRKTAAVSLCALEDVFDKQFGRQQAARRLLRYQKGRPTGGTVVRLDQLGEDVQALSLTQQARLAVYLVARAGGLRWMADLDEDILFAIRHPGDSHTAAAEELNRVDCWHRTDVVV